MRSVENLRIPRDDGLPPNVLRQGDGWWVDADGEEHVDYDYYKNVGTKDITPLEKKEPPIPDKEQVPARRHTTIIKYGNKDIVLKEGFASDERFTQSEQELYIEIPFEAISVMHLSINNRDNVNNSLGLVRDSENPIGRRTLDGRTYGDVYEKKGKKSRKNHITYEEHTKIMKLKEPYVVIGNGNLGNNPWYVAWQKKEAQRRFALSNEPDTREYTVFLFSDETEPRMMHYCTVTKRGITPKTGDTLNNVTWAVSGQPIVRDNKPVELESIVEQFYDIRHIFDMGDFGPKKAQNIERLRLFYEVTEKVDWLTAYCGFKMLKIPSARFIHSILGLKQDNLIIAHQYGTIEEIAEKISAKGIDDAIILDQGGSCGCYTGGIGSGVFPNPGFINKSSCFRDSRISTIGIELKYL